MKYGIIADIHSNLHALETVMDWLAGEEKVDAYICLGDIVGYGAKPNECVGVIRKLNKCLNVVGNHEWAVMGLADMSCFNPVARVSLKWTAGQLTDDNKKWLNGMKKVLKKKNFMMVHGSPSDPVNEYVTNESVFIENMSLIDPNICLIGHTHISEYFYANSSGKIEAVLLKDNGIIEIKSSYKYLINCGSVGQPRGGTDNRASFGIYDDKTRIIRIKKLSYDIRKTQKEIIKAGLPEILAVRLKEGY